MSDKILKVGIIGIVVTALCCFTPILVWIFIAAGFIGAVGYLDYILWLLDVSSGLGDV